MALGHSSPSKQKQAELKKTLFIDRYYGQVAEIIVGFPQLQKDLKTISFGLLRWNPWGITPKLSALSDFLEAALLSLFSQPSQWLFNFPFAHIKSLCTENINGM